MPSNFADAMHGFVQASNSMEAAEHVKAMGGEAYTEESVDEIIERAERRLAQAGDVLVAHGRGCASGSQTLA